MKKKLKITKEKLTNLIKETIFSVINEQKLGVEPNLNDFSIFNLNINDYRKLYKDFRYVATPILDGRSLYEEYTSKKPIAEMCDPNDIVSNIAEKYSLNPESVRVFEAENKIYILIVLAKLGVNDILIEEDLEKLGYFLSKRGEIRKIEDMDFQILQFEPTSQIQKDETENILKKCSYLYHWSPNYLVENILKNGLIPSHKNDTFKYPPRTYLMKCNSPLEEIDELGRQLCFHNQNKQNDGKYTLFKVYINNIDNSIRFYLDPNSAIGIYTEQNIPPSSIEELGTVNYKKQLLSKK